MSTSKATLSKKDMPTSSIVMKTPTFSDDTFSFPQNDNRQYVIKEEKGEREQDGQIVEVSLIRSHNNDNDRTIFFKNVD